MNLENRLLPSSRVSLLPTKSALLHNEQKVSPYLVTLRAGASRTPSFSRHPLQARAASKTGRPRGAGRALTRKRKRQSREGDAAHPVKPGGPNAVAFTLPPSEPGGPDPPLGPGGPTPPGGPRSPGAPESPCRGKWNTPVRRPSAGEGPAPSPVLVVFPCRPLGS